MAIQKSRSFILPMMNFSEEATKQIKNTYLGNTEYEGENNWGKYFYIELDYEDIKSITNEFLTHPQYITHFHSANDTLFYVFEITYNQRKIVDPFMDGKYSLIDREYVNKYFNKFINGNVSLNWRILNKDENWEMPSSTKALRTYWFERIGIELPINAEVWSRPEMKYEIYSFIESNITAEEIQPAGLSVQ